MTPSERQKLLDELSPDELAAQLQWEAEQERKKDQFPEMQPAHEAAMDAHLAEIDKRERLRRAKLRYPLDASGRMPAFYLADGQIKVRIVDANGVQQYAQDNKVRAAIKDCPDVLGIGLSAANAASDNFSIEEGGEYYAAGAGKGISGFRADLGLCDDLFGNREDAWSNTVRQKRWDWYTDDFGHRMKPRAKRILMNTRWHEMDVAGRIVAQIEAGHVRGKIIDIPAIAGDNDPVGREPGEYLWDEPGGYDYGRYLRDRQQETSPMMWAAMFQQRPAPEDGDYFKAEWLKPYEVAPHKDTMRIYGASDYAVSADKGDFTVHLVVGIDPEGRMFLLDMWRKQAAPDDWVETFCDLVIKWDPMCWAEEQGQIRSSVGPFLDKRQMERRAYAAREQFPTRGDKAVRAQSIRGRMALHGLHVPESAPWYADFKSELMSFPAGRHDDIVDALGLIGQLMDKMISGKALKKEKPTYRDRWDDIFAQDDHERSWRVA